jgi:nucleotide-binding universal stress UspA family protein
LDYDPLRIKNVLVPVDGSRAGFNALALACHLAKRNKGTVYAVYVIEVARNLALDAEMPSEARSGEDILTEAERVADELLQARDQGHAIVDEAADREVDAIVMGIGLELMLGEFQMAAAAQYVAKHAPCQVILYREPVRE